MTISEYVRNINTRYKTGISREHAYRGDLQNLLEGMLKNAVSIVEAVDNVPLKAWELTIGGYQPAEKWGSLHNVIYIPLQKESSRPGLLLTIGRSRLNCIYLPCLG